MNKAWFVIALVSSIALAGCTSPDEGSSAQPGATYNVPVEAAHAINGADRTITVKVTQDGQELGTGTYSTAGKAADDFETVFTVKASGGPLKLQAFEGSNPLNFKSIDPAKCTDPNFQIHVVDGAVHLWSNCD